MQLDDRDIICETDYSPLSNAELAAQIEWHASAMSGATAYDLERITGPARALLARAKAAEAAREETADRLVFEMEQRETLAARAEAAERERDDANIEVALEQANAAEAWGRAEAAEALAYQRLEDALFAEQRATDADIRAEETDADASRLRLELMAANLDIEALADRVAELEAQLAAQQWRPVTEEPTVDDSYLVYRAAPPTAAPWHYDFAVWDNGHGWETKGFTHWQPLPPAPQETTP